MAGGIPHAADRGLVIGSVAQALGPAQGFFPAPVAVAAYREKDALLREPCEDGAGDDGSLAALSCVRRKPDGFGLRAWRRPLTFDIPVGDQSASPAVSGSGGVQSLSFRLIAASVLQLGLLRRGGGMRRLFCASGPSTPVPHDMIFAAWALSARIRRSMGRESWRWRRAGLWGLP
jgi:hypothetical protein